METHRIDALNHPRYGVSLAKALDALVCPAPPQHVMSTGATKRRWGGVWSNGSSEQTPPLPNGNSSARTGLRLCCAWADHRQGRSTPPGESWSTP